MNLTNSLVSPFTHKELSECLSFGCSDEGDECNCFYSTECATSLFKYYTIDECKDALSSK